MNLKSMCVCVCAPGGGGGGGGGEGEEGAHLHPCIRLLHCCNDKIGRAVSYFERSSSTENRNKSSGPMLKLIVESHY